jgi:hypothetical protein
MPDYSKGKIYRLTCDNPNLVYYGSTTLKLTHRFYQHKAQKVNCCSKKLFEVGGVEIELVLECPCETQKELREIEQTYIDNDECINKRNANLNKKEYYRKYQELKYQEYLFTKDIFDEYFS